MTSSSPIRVLLIEDSPTDADLIALSLEEVTSVKFAVTHAETLKEGLRALDEQAFDVVLVDLSLPDSYGIETCIRVHTHAWLPAAAVRAGSLCRPRVCDAPPLCA